MTRVLESIALLRTLFTLAIVVVAQAGCGNRVVESTPPAIATTNTSAPKLPDIAAIEKRYGMKVPQRPKLKIDETTYNFGDMDPMSSGKHTFIIRNVGSAPLHLRQGETTCKCTLSQLSNGTVAPDSQAEVTLEWNTGRKFSFYQQSAEILTDDHEHSRLVLTITGNVRTNIKFNSEVVALGDFLPTEKRTGKLLVYSERLKEFQLTEAVVTNTAYQVQTRPATEQELTAVGGVAGHYVTVMTPDHLPKGEIGDYLRLKIQDTPDSEPEQFDIPIHGRVQGRMAVVGGAIDSDGDIMLGVLPYGKGVKKKLMVKVRDELKDLGEVQIKVHPEFLKVALTPTANVAESGLYNLTIEVPKEAEPCGHRGDAVGYAEFTFTHPRVDKLRVQVDFSIRPPVELR